MHFEGWYLKHQKNQDTISFIPGKSDESAFIQVITNDHSYHVPYSLSEYKHSHNIRIENNIFSKNGLKVNIKDEKLKIYGKILYKNMTPIKYDIMGIFKYFPMECRHGIISMHHKLDGFICINDRRIDFTNGVGYIESDSGTSFPKKYLWVHCNDFKEKCSIMVSIADIPFMGINFKGCIGIVNFNNKEYRFATYLGVKIINYNDKEIILKQGRLRLEIDVFDHNAQQLYAPHQGKMTRKIHESTSCTARFKFFVHGVMLFDLQSDHTSFEFVQ